MSQWYVLKHGRNTCRYTIHLLLCTMRAVVETLLSSYLLGLAHGRTLWAGSKNLRLKIFDIRQSRIVITLSVVYGLRLSDLNKVTTFLL